MRTSRSSASFVARAQFYVRHANFCEREPDHAPFFGPVTMWHGRVAGFLMEWVTRFNTPRLHASLDCRTKPTIDAFRAYTNLDQREVAA